MWNIGSLLAARLVLAGSAYTSGSRIQSTGETIAAYDALEYSAAYE